MKKILMFLLLPLAAILTFASCKDDNSEEIIKEIKVSPTEANVAIGGTIKLTATVTPESLASKVVWSSDTPAVADVDQQGVVTGVAEGRAIISAKVGDKSATATITVVKDAVPITSITLTPAEDLSVYTEDTFTLEAVVEPENTTDDKTITFSSSDETVASISADGLVTALKGGETTLKASVASGIEASIKLTVIEQFADAEAEPEYTRWLHTMDFTAIQASMGGVTISYDDQNRITGFLMSTAGLNARFTYSANTIVAESYDNEGTVFEKSTITLNDAGYAIKEVVENPSAVEPSTLKYRYRNGKIDRIIKEVTADGQTTDQTLMDFTWENGNMTKFTDVAATGVTTTLTYTDKDNKLNVDVIGLMGMGIYNQDMAYNYTSMFKLKGWRTNKLAAVSATNVDLSYNMDTQGYPTAVLMYGMYAIPFTYTDQILPTSITDTRGSETITYKIAKFGDQVWMTEDLKATKYRDGSAIALSDPSGLLGPVVTMSGSTSTTDNPYQGVYYRESYTDILTGQEVVNVYYNSIVMFDTREICPEGWRMPNDEDWKTLITTLGGTLNSDGLSFTGGADAMRDPAQFNAGYNYYYALLSGSWSVQNTNKTIYYWSLTTRSGLGTAWIDDGTVNGTLRGVRKRSNVNGNINMNTSANVALGDANYDRGTSIRCIMAE
jgi:uncharacterized protein (TIGR02145 family)